MIDASGPDDDLVEAPGLQRTRHRRHQNALHRPVKPAEPTIDHRLDPRQRPAHADHLGKAGMIAGREAQASAQTETTSSQAERALRRDVDGLRGKGRDLVTDAVRAGDAQADFRIGREAEGRPAIGGHDLQHMAASFEEIRDPG